MNRYRKGQEVERIAIATLLVLGYLWVHRTHRSSFRTRAGNYGSNVGDIFGCIDLIAKGPISLVDGRTKWIQVTAGRDVGRKIRDLAQIPWNPAHDCVEIWRYVGGRKTIDGRTGKPRQRHYFQVYRLDEGFELRKDNRIPAEVKS